MEIFDNSLKNNDKEFINIDSNVNITIKTIDPHNNFYIENWTKITIVNKLQELKIIYPYII